MRGRRGTGGGVLEFRTRSVLDLVEQRKDVGEIRIVEIPAGDSSWDERSVSFNSFTRGAHYEDVFNTSMVIDVRPDPQRGAVTRTPINHAVIQRRLDGRTRRLALIALGSVNAALLAREANDAATLSFNLAT